MVFACTCPGRESAAVIDTLAALTGQCTASKSFTCHTLFFNDNNARVILPNRLSPVAFLRKPGVSIDGLPLEGASRYEGWPGMQPRNSPHSVDLISLNHSTPHLGLAFAPPDLLGRNLGGA